MNRPEDIMEKLGYYSAVVHGFSMYPLLVDHKDSVYIEKIDTFKKYDVLLFRRKDGQLVLHRLIGFSDDMLVLCGDNDFIAEKIYKNQVIGIMKEFSHNGKVYKVNNIWYKIYSKVWNLSFTTKRMLRFIYSSFNKVKSKLVRK